MNHLGYRHTIGRRQTEHAGGVDGRNFNGADCRKLYAREPVRLNARNEYDRVRAAFGQALHDSAPLARGGKQNPFADTAMLGNTARLLARTSTPDVPSQCYLEKKGSARQVNVKRAKVHPQLAERRGTGLDKRLPRRPRDGIRNAIRCGWYPSKRQEEIIRNLKVEQVDEQIVHEAVLCPPAVERFHHRLVVHTNQDLGPPQAIGVALTN